MKCPKCGKENADNVRFCRFCGEVIKDTGRQTRVNNEYLSVPESNTKTEEIREIIGKMFSYLQYIEDKFAAESNEYEKKIAELRKSLDAVKEENKKLSIDLGLYQDRADEAEKLIAELKKELQQKEADLREKTRSIKPLTSSENKTPVFPPLPGETVIWTHDDSSEIRFVDDQELDILSFNNSKNNTVSPDNGKPRPIYCSECGRLLNSNSRFCQGCGMKIEDMI